MKQVALAMAAKSYERKLTDAELKDVVAYMRSSIQ